ncbi:hypothetical protein [Microbulbifer mangrovi]|uniref:hypothetical protein n=1 Tax=Microbulbifer mangrovi TaxID=927787 RepID=UPI00099062A6|nr:hypothetical protein [Microbulbifer mangrovi]
MLLHTDRLPSGYAMIGQAENIGFDAERLFFVRSDTHLFVLSKSPVLSFQKEDEPGIKVAQSVYPVTAAAWFVEAVENQLWKSSKEGGLPEGVYHVVKEIDGEEIKVSRDMNCGARYQKGISWKNLSRKPIDRNFGYQERQITDQALIEGGVLDILRKVI